MHETLKVRMLPDTTIYRNLAYASHIFRSFLLIQNLYVFLALSVADIIHTLSNWTHVNLFSLEERQKKYTFTEIFVIL